MPFFPRCCKTSKNQFHSSLGFLFFFFFLKNLCQLKLKLLITHHSGEAYAHPSTWDYGRQTFFIYIDTSIIYRLPTAPILMLKRQLFTFYTRIKQFVPFLNKTCWVIDCNWNMGWKLVWTKWIWFISGKLRQGGGSKQFQYNRLACWWFGVIYWLWIRAGVCQTFSTGEAWSAPTILKVKKNDCVNVLFFTYLNLSVFICVVSIAFQSPFCFYFHLKLFPSVLLGTI